MSHSPLYHLFPSLPQQHESQSPNHFPSKFNAATNAADHVTDPNSIINTGNTFYRLDENLNSSIPSPPALVSLCHSRLSRQENRQPPLQILSTTPSNQSLIHNPFVNTASSNICKPSTHPHHIPLPSLDTFENIDIILHQHNTATNVPFNSSMSTLTATKAKDNNKPPCHDTLSTTSEPPSPTPSTDDISFDLALGILSAMRKPDSTTPSKRKKTQTTKSCPASLFTKPIKKRPRTRYHNWTYAEDEILCDIFTRIDRKHQAYEVEKRLQRTFEEAQLRWFAEVGPFVLGKPWSEKEIEKVKELERHVKDEVEEWVRGARDFQGRSVWGVVSSSRRWKEMDTRGKNQVSTVRA